MSSKQATTSKTRPAATPSGRPRLSPLERARRDALKAKRHLEAADSEFNERLALDGETSDARAAAVKAVANRRMQHAKRVNDARKALSSARADVRDGKAGAKSQQKKAKAEERVEWEAFRKLPDLGFTQAEWDDPANEMFRVREMGRPQLDVEIKRVRAKEALAEALERVKLEEAKAGEKHIPLSKLKDPVKTSRGPGIGRPKLDSLGIMDRKIALLEKKIGRIEAGKDVRRKPGTKISPRALTKEQKIERATKEIEQLRALIAKGEAELDARGKLARKLKGLRDERRRVTIAIRDAEGPTEDLERRHEELAVMIGQKIEQIDALDAQAVEEKDTAAEAPAEAVQAQHSPEEGSAAESTKTAKAPPIDRKVAAKGAKKSEPTSVRPGKGVAMGISPQMLRQRSELRSKIAKIEERYAQIIEKLFSEFEPEIAVSLAESVEGRREEELSKVRAEAEALELA